jgi:uncharacterized BrkB/YihY/UPF0761 family membrane protein
VILVVWVYYSAQIFFLGAEFTKVFADRHGSRPSHYPQGMVISCGQPEVSQQAPRIIAPTEFAQPKPASPASIEKP